MKRFLICLTVVFVALAFVNCKTGGEGSSALPGGKFNLHDLFDKFGKGKGKDKCTEVAEGGDIDTEYRHWGTQDPRSWLPRELPDARITYKNSNFLYSDQQTHYADIRIPKNDKLRTAAGYPVMVVIHGGAWRSQTTLDRLSPLAEALTDFGIASWNIEFSKLGNTEGPPNFTQHGGYPGSFLDVGEAVDYLRTIAPEYNLDLSRVIILGHSSGGQLALWAASRHKIDPSSPLYVADPLPIKGVVSLAGIADMEYALNVGNRVDILTYLAVASNTDAALLFPSTSPYQMLPNGVRTSHLVGTDDNQWRIDAIHNYVNQVITLGGEAHATDLEGASEIDVLDPCSPAWPTLVREVFWVLGEQPPCGSLNKSKFCPVNGIPPLP